MLKLNAFQLKLLAIIGMITSHMVIAWWGVIPTWLRFPMYAAGGLTFPIMAYFVAEGYRHTSNVKKYILRVLLFGLLALPFHILTITLPMSGGNPLLYPFLNIMFNIVVSLLVLILYDKMRSRLAFWLLYIVIIAPLSLALLEWYFVGVTMVLMAHIIKNETARRVVPPLFAAVFFLAVGIFVSLMTSPYLAVQFAEAGVNLPLLLNTEFTPVQMIFCLGMIVAALLLKGYSGERGRRMKWLFYVIYPVHFVILFAGMLIIRAMGLA